MSKKNTGKKVSIQDGKPPSPGHQTRFQSQQVKAEQPADCRGQRDALTDSLPESIHEKNNQHADPIQRESSAPSTTDRVGCSKSATSLCNTSHSTSGQQGIPIIDEPQFTRNAVVIPAQEKEHVAVDIPAKEDRSITVPYKITPEERFANKTMSLNPLTTTDNDVSKYDFRASSETPPKDTCLYSSHFERPINETAAQYLADREARQKRRAEADLLFRMLGVANEDEVLSVSD